jgi:polysaccharide lyase-like protein
VGVAPTTSRVSPSGRLAQLAICSVAALTLLLTAASSAEANQRGDGSPAARSLTAKDGGQRHAQKARARRKQAQRRRRALNRKLRRASRSAAVASNSAVGGRHAKRAQPAAASDGTLDAGFEQGLLNWNTAGVGEVIPSVVGDNVRSGAGASKVVLTGTQSRSELILGGNGGGSTNGMVEFTEGEEYYYAFSFYIESMVYGGPGAHNLIMQFKSDGEGSPNFGLQLWDYEGDDGESGGRGLWSHSDAMGGDRFLSPVSEQAWHDVVIHFKASRQDAGFYELYLDGQLIDSRSGVSMIRPDRSYAYIKNGLYRNGDDASGTSELRLDAVRLGPTPSSVLPG